MKILFISPTFSGAGGIGPHAFRVSEKLSQEGHDIELMDTPHIPIKTLKYVSFSVFGTLKALSNSKTYDVVHAWNVPSAFIMKHIKAKKENTFNSWYLFRTSKNATFQISRKYCYF